MELNPSPRISHLSWGLIEVEVGRKFKDARLFPGGAEEWDWNLNGTSHSAGIAPADVDDLLQHGATAVVLSRGILGRLTVTAKAITLLESRGVDYYVHRTEEAVRVYNELAETESVAGLFHSTC